MLSTSAPSSVPSLKEQLVREACSMARRLVTSGSRVPPSLIQAANDFETALEHRKPIDMAALAGTHERLSRLVAPAKPGTLYLLDFSFHMQGHKASSLGPIKIQRDLVRVAMVCVGVFIVLSVLALVDASPHIDLADTVLSPGDDPSKDRHGMLIVREALERVFWLSAAGIGASFAILFTLTDQITARTFDPDETPSYWVKFFLGLVAGFILVALVPFESGAGPEGATTSTQALGPPTIALLGGFSASAVYRILTRMVEALESVFTGGAKEQAAAAEKATASRAAEESSQARMAVAGQLLDLQQQLAAGLPAAHAAAQIRQVVSALVPASTEFSNSMQPEPVQEPAPAVADAPAPAVADAPAPAADAPDKVPAFAVVSDAPPAAEPSAPAAADAAAEAPSQDPAAPAPAAVG
jgi:hypothetical protein